MNTRGELPYLYYPRMNQTRILNPHRTPAGGGGGGFDPDSLVLRVTTTTASESVTIPGRSSWSYSGTIDFGDGNTDTFSSYNDAGLTNTYATAGTYDIEIGGTFPALYFNNSGSKLKLVSIEQWGDVGYNGDMTSAFFGCTNLVSLAADTDNAAPTNGTNAFYSCSGLESLPAGLLESLTVGTNMFRSSGLMSLPSGMTLGALTSASAMFFGASVSAVASSVTLASLTTGANMFNGGNTIATADYSTLLVNIEANNSNGSVSFHGGSSKYNTAGGVARAALIADHSWTIADGGVA